MQRHHRLTGESRISAVHRSGRSAANRLLVFRTNPNGLDHSRFCFVAGKRVGNAVVRNRVKRRLRELLRNSQINPGWDVVIMARRGAGEAEFGKLQHAVADLTRRSKLIRPERNS